MTKVDEFTMTLGKLQADLLKARLVSFQDNFSSDMVKEVEDFFKLQAQQRLVDCDLTVEDQGRRKRFLVKISDEKPIP